MLEKPTTGNHINQPLNYVLKIALADRAIHEETPERTAADFIKENPTKALNLLNGEAVDGAPDFTPDIWLKVIKKMRMAVLLEHINAPQTLLKEIANLINPSLKSSATIA